MSNQDNLTNVNKILSDSKKQKYINNLKKFSIDHWEESDIIKKVTKNMIPNEYPETDISEEVAKRVSEKLNNEN